MKNIALLGASGSIGTSTLEVIRRHQDKFNLVAFSVFSKVNLIEEILETFKDVRIVAVRSLNEVNDLTYVFTDANTIANGDLIIYNDGYAINKGAKVSADTSVWIEYTIPIDYRNFTTFPTHIVVSCATSQFGDYFTGYSKAELKIDAMELIYE